MKQLLTIAMIFAASSASADGYSQKQGVVVDVEAVYGTDYKYVTQEQCSEKRVPIYGTTGGSTGDALAGAIIGGAIGNQFGSGSGKDAMTVLGAIIGADAASKPRRGVVDYTYEWRCELVEIPQEIRTFHHYQITYKMNGKYYRVNTDRIFEVGQRIVINE